MSYSEALEQQVRLARWAERYRSSSDEYWDARANSDVVREWARKTLASTLLEAETFYWSSAVLATVRESAKTLDRWTLTAEVVPARGGFFWYANPVRLIVQPEEEEFLFQAVAWRSDGEGLWITWFAQSIVAGHLRPAMATAWNWNDCLSSMIERPLPDGSDVPPELALQTAKEFAACLAFLRQRILVAPAHRAERHAVKRLEREGWTHEPLIRVVELRRRAAQSKPSDDPKTVEWSHQWVVSGHWRQQPYPSLGIVQPKWIMPHVKGPPDKPLSPPRAKVFAVVR